MSDCKRLSRGMVISYLGSIPTIDDSVFIAPNATVIGDVHIEIDSSIWFGAVLRGDEVAICIGKRSNIQDGVIIHGDEGQNVEIGDDVTIGHGAIIHGCKIENGALIGMGSIILDGVVVERGALVAAGAVVSPGKRVSANTLWAGVPAKPIRELDKDTQNTLLNGVEHYQRQSGIYRSVDVKKV